MKAVSVIIPVYNLEKYIEESLDSVRNQTLKDIEIICINDGSTDSSEALIKNYQEKDDRIQLISKENGGQARARNLGISRAQGKYIYFLDGDDLLVPDCLEKAYSCAEENALDVVMFNGTTFYESEDLEEGFESFRNLYQHKREYEGIYDGQDLFVEMMDHGDYIVTPCLQLTSTEYMRREQVLFPEGIIHEDNLFLFYIMMTAKRIMHIPACLFERRVRFDSIMTKPRGYKNYIGLYSCCYGKLEYAAHHELKLEAVRYMNEGIFYHLKKIQDYYDNYMSEEEQERSREDLKGKELTVEMLIPVFQQAHESINLSRRVKKGIEKSNEWQRAAQKLEKENEKLTEQMNLLISQMNLLTQQNKKQKKQLEEIKASSSFQIGKMITWLPRKIKEMLKKK